MTRAWSLLIVAAPIVALSLSVRADDPAPRPLPLNVLDKAAPGDWSACVRRTEAKTNPRMNDQRVITWTVSGAENDQVTIHCEESPDKDKRSRTLTGTKRAGLSLEDLLQEEAGTIAAGDTVDEKHTVLDHEFACKKLTTSIKVFNQDDETLTVWMSPEVAAPGIVEIEIYGNDENGAYDIDYTLGGYGNGDKVTWGKSIHDLVAAFPTK